jgi:hypothetical protein
MSISEFILRDVSKAVRNPFLLTELVFAPGRTDEELTRA